MSTPTRPVLRWHGGKWKLAPWIISHFPPHRVYVEPFGGAASPLLRKERCYAEVYNDLDDEVVNLFRVLRDDFAAERLAKHLRLTAFARAEFEESYDVSDVGVVERARRLVIRSFMGMGAVSNGVDSKGTGFRNNTKREGTIPAHDWAGYPDCLRLVIARFAGVVIEHRPAMEVMAAHDGPDTLHYVDPPYLAETRSKRSRRKGGLLAYAHELTHDDHVLLLSFLRGRAGMVIVSGYPSALYEERLTGWRRVETEAMADGALPRTEVLWLNPACVVALDREKSGGPLFDQADICTDSHTEAGVVG